MGAFRGENSLLSGVGPSCWLFILQCGALQLMRTFVVNMWYFMLFSNFDVLAYWWMRLLLFCSDPIRGEGTQWTHCRVAYPLRTYACVVPFFSPWSGRYTRCHAFVFKAGSAFWAKP